MIVQMKSRVYFLLILPVFCILTEFHADAQLWKMRRFEAVAGIGPSFFFGDIGGFSKGENVLGIKDVSIKQTRFNVNMNLKYRILEDLNLRLSFTTALLRATDSRGSNQGRGMSASTSIFEPALIGEFYFIKNNTENSYLFSKGQRGGLKLLIDNMDFYAFAGLGGASYSVESNSEITLAGPAKSGFTTVIPAGVGMNLIFSADFNFGVEIGGRYSFSDYLDGYTSQYSSSNDVYYFLNFTVAYKMRTGPNGLPTFKRK